MSVNYEHIEKVRANQDFIRQRENDTNKLRTSCAGRGHTTAGTCGFHHILPVSSMQDGQIAFQKKLTFFHKCMAVTTWNTNGKDNLVGLPIKSALVGRNPKVPDWPCHQWGHPAYNIKVVESLNSNLWQPLDDQAADCRAKGKDIAEEIEEMSIHWFDFLEDRGKEERGAGYCWLHKNDPGMEDTWHIPFSMDPDGGEPRKPPKDFGGTVGAAGEWMKEVFKFAR